MPEKAATLRVKAAHFTQELNAMIASQETSPARSAKMKR
jgi:hypothetical protein